MSDDTRSTRVDSYARNVVFAFLYEISIEYLIDKNDTVTCSQGLILCT